MSISSNFPTSRPALSLNFLRATSLDPRITFTRNSIATYFDDAGVLNTVAANVPRFDYNPSTLVPLGLLIEETRTNSIRNNTMVGASAPSTPPTNWGIWTSGTNGVNSTVVGTSTENGINYIDIRFHTPTVTSVAFSNGTAIRFETTTQIAAASGQNWSSSFYAKLVGGSTANATITHFIVERDNTGSSLATFSTDITSSLTSSNLNSNRLSMSRTLANASTSYITNEIRLSADLGVAIDFTIRVGMPQLEQGLFVTSVIPTSTVAVLRPGDLATMTGTNFSSWFNINAGTFVVEFDVSTFTAIQPIFIARNSDYSDLIRSFTRSSVAGAQSFQVQDSSVLYLNAGSVNATSLNTVTKTALAYSSTGQVGLLNGGAITTNGSSTISTIDATSLEIGHIDGVGSDYMNGHIRYLTYYPSRLTNSQLQSLTYYSPLIPTLTLNFINTAVLDPRITFTRTLNTATYFDSNGLLQTALANTPRFDYDPASLLSRGLLIEETRENKMLYSRDMTQSAWSKTDTTVNRNQTGIDGVANTACLLTQGSASNSIITQIGATGAGTYTVSAVLKRGNNDWVVLNVAEYTTYSAARQWVNLSTGAKGTTTTSGGGVINASGTVTALGNGWYRVTITGTTTTAGNVVFEVWATTADNNGTRSSNATYIVDCAQFEVGAFATSIINTTTTTVTRSVDNAVMTGTNFSSWYNPTAGTIYAEYFVSVLAQAGVVSLNDGTLNNKMDIRPQTTGSIATNGGVAQWALVTGAISTTTTNKFALAYAQDNIGAVINAGTVQTDTSATIPTVTNLQLGGLDGSTTSFKLNGYIRSVTYYSTRLFDSQIKTLTQS